MICFDELVGNLKGSEDRKLISILECYVLCFSVCSLHSHRGTNNVFFFLLQVFLNEKFVGILDHFTDRLNIEVYIKLCISMGVTLC